MKYLYKRLLTNIIMYLFSFSIIVFILVKFLARLCQAKAGQSYG